MAGQRRIRLRSRARAEAAELRAERRLLPRWARLCGWSAASFCGLAILLGITAYALVVSGFVGLDLLRPYVAREIEQRLGHGETVEIGSINAARSEDGDFVVRVNDIAVRNAQGEVVASAPQAEIGIRTSLLPWRSAPQRIALIGAELSVHINAQGELSVATGRGAKPIVAAQPAQPAPEPPNTAPAAPPAANGPETPAPAAQAPAAQVFDPTHLPALATLAQAIDNGGFGGTELTEAGLKNGTLRIESEASGQKWVFDNINIDVARPAAGGATVDFDATGANGPWSAQIVIGPLDQDHRQMSFEVRDLASRDLLAAAGKNDGSIIATSPLGLRLEADIGREGRVASARGRVVVGAGKLQMGADAAGMMLIEQVVVDVRLDPARRLFVIDPLSIKADPLDLTFAAELSPPVDSTDPWRLHTTRIHGLFGGGGPDAEKEPPLLLDQGAFDLRFEPATKKLIVEKAVFSGPQGGLTIDGSFDAGLPDPVLTMNVVGTPMSVTSLKRLWPIVAAPDVRRWIYEHVVSGDVTRTNIRFAAPLSSIGNKDRPLPTEGAAVEVAGVNGVIRAAPGLPPLLNAALLVQATGRSAHAVATDVVMETPGGRKLSLPESVLDVPNTIMPNPTAKLSVKVEGPAAAAADMLSTPALKSPGNDPFDPGAIKGQISGTAQINLTLREPMSMKDVDYAFEADLTDFSADKIFQGQKLDDATVKLFATASTTLLRGDGKIAGAPASFEINKPRDGADMSFRFAANLDDAARDKMNIELAGLSGSVGVKITGTMGAKEKKGTAELDLTAARLAELVPGWSKPAGKPAKLTADATVRSDSIKIDNLAVTGTGVNIRGDVDLSGKGDLVSANLPTFQLSDGDKASVKIDIEGGVAKITVRGEVIEARAFLKSLLDAPIAGTSAQKKPADIDLDVNLGVVKGNNGEAMRQAVLRMSRRDGNLRTFSLAALVGRDGGVKGDLRPDRTGRPALQILTSDAGALLRFVDFYSRIYGGDLWVSVDPPNATGKPQDGTVNMRDFVIRGEPGLDRLIAAAPDKTKDGRLQPGGAVAFQKLQVEFQRSAGRLQIRDGAIWGPAIGSTFDGVLDFIGDKVSVRGTFVPAYGLNNLFSRLPVLGFFLGGGPNEGLVGVTYEIVGPLSGPTLRINPISAVAPGFLRKIFEFRQSPDPTPPALVPAR